MNQRLLNEIKSSSQKLKKHTSLTIRVTEEQHDELLQYCEKAGVSQNKLFLHLLEKFIFKK